MNNINERVRYFREKHGLNQKEFGEMLGLSESTVSHIEKGETGLSLQKIINICRHLRVSPNELLGVGNQGETFSDPDDIHKRYYELDEHGKLIVRTLLEQEHNRIREGTPTRTIIYPLIEDQKTIELDYFPQAAGMGRGQDVTPHFPDKLELSDTQVPDYTNFVIRVTGDSMLPTFEPGDILFVQKTNHLNPGDIGVFVVDGETMVKEMGEGKLISHNPKYEPINQADSCIIQGRILGKLDQRKENA